MTPLSFKNCIYSMLFSFFALQAAFAQTDLDSVRQKIILDALNSVPTEWIAPVEAADIHIKNGTGRVDVNKKSKLSYFIQTENPTDAASQITLIPMATSRYTATYYQTDEWWDAHKAEIDAAKVKGIRAPRQDIAEVESWLRQMKLSTNPVVLQIGPDQRLRTVRLQEYLLDYYLKNFTKNGKITLYRGGEKLTETSDWLRGIRPRGARYWTPTATYAWRYARKNASFLEDLVNGLAPLYVFEIPVEQFRSMVQRSDRKLTLGTELTKRVHDSFDRSGTFMDHLLGQSDYMGIGDIGLEFEIRASSRGANQMLPYFKSTIGIEELVIDRVNLLDRTLARLVNARPAEADRLKLQYESRKEQAVLEGKILLAIQLKSSRETLETLSAELGSKPFSEIANVDGINFREFFQGKMRGLMSGAEVSANELRQLNDRLKGKFNKVGIKCSSVLM